jgi:hypothetical protein
MTPPSWGITTKVGGASQLKALDIRFIQTIEAIVQPPGILLLCRPCKPKVLSFCVYEAKFLLRRIMLCALSFSEFPLGSKKLHLLKIT